MLLCIVLLKRFWAVNVQAGQQENFEKVREVKHIKFTQGK